MKTSNLTLILIAIVLVTFSSCRKNCNDTLDCGQQQQQYGNYQQSIIGNSSNTYTNTTTTTNTNTTTTTNYVTDSTYFNFSDPGAILSFDDSPESNVGDTVWVLTSCTLDGPNETGTVVNDAEHVIITSATTYRKVGPSYNACHAKLAHYRSDMPKLKGDIFERFRPGTARNMLIVRISEI